MEIEFKASVVQLILNGKAEEAVELLGKHYSVRSPNIKVGLPRGHRKNTLGCYTAKNQTIYLLNSEALKQPFIVLHEFYHHLRTSIDKKHKGTERYANRFAEEFVGAYRTIITYTDKKQSETRVDRYC